jgi:exosortase
MAARKRFDTSMFHRWKLIWLLPVIGLLPMLWLEGVKLWNLAHFQFFPIAMGFAFWQLFQRAKPGPVSRGRELGGTALCIAGGLSGVASLWLFSPWVAHTAFVTLLMGWGILAIANETWARVLGVASLLIVCIPLPGNMDKSLIQLLQSVSSVVCENVLDAVSVPHLREGSIIQLESKRLFVEEACSGVDSLYALAAVALAMLVYQRAPLLPSLFTMLTVPFWAIMGNLIRLIVIALSIQWLGVDISGGWSHQLLGFVVFLIVSCCHLATAHSFKYLFSSLGMDRTRNGISSLYNAISAWPKAMEKNELLTSAPYALRPFTQWSMAAFAVVTFVLGGVASPFVPKESLLLSGLSLAPELEQLLPGNEEFSRSFSEFHKVGYNNSIREKFSTFGRYSHTWWFENKKRSQCIVSLDFPFFTFHDLAICYVLSGWTITKEEFFSMPNRSSEHPTLKRFQMSNSLGRNGVVWFTHYDLNSKLMELSPEVLAVQRNDATLAGRIADRNRRIDVMQFQFQMFIETAEPLTDYELSEYDKLYAMFLAEILEKSKPALAEIKRIQGE